MPEQPAQVPVWTLATEATSVPDILGDEAMTPARLAELRGALASFSKSPIATLEVHPLERHAERTGGIALRAASPLARELAKLLSETVKATPSAAPTLAAAETGEVLYRMVVPAKVAAEYAKGLVQPMQSKAVADGIYGGLRGASNIVSNASFVPVAGKAAVAGAATGSAATAGVAVATAGALTLAAPLVLMAVAVGASAYADHQRQKAIENITTLLQQLKQANLDSERSELDGCRDAIDKATSILFDQGKVGFSLGLDSASFAISKAIGITELRLRNWQNAIAALPPGTIELSTLTKSFPGINESGGEFRAHLELARLAIALKRRVLVLQAVEHAQLEGDDNPFAAFVANLREDEKRVQTLDADIASVLRRLSTLELKRHGGVRSPVFTAGEVDGLLRAAYRLRAFGDELDLAPVRGDVAIEIERARDGSLVVYAPEEI